MSLDVLPLLRSPKLADAGFSHGFSTRAGGVSPPPFDSFDLGIQRPGDALRENQRRLLAALGGERLVQARQVHGARVFAVERSLPPVDAGGAIDVDADALVARLEGDVVMIRVADCAPVLVADRKTGHVAAIHAGWPGTVAGVVRAGISALGGADLVAAIGPCIGACCFEVGADVGARIVAASDPSVVVRREIKHGVEKQWIDLRRAVRLQLAAASVDDVDDVGGCTVCEAARFYSHRRERDASGRLGGAITPGARPGR